MDQASGRAGEGHSEGHGKQRRPGPMHSGGKGGGGLGLSVAYKRLWIRLIEERPRTMVNRPWRRPQ